MMTTKTLAGRPSLSMGTLPGLPALVLEESSAALGKTAGKDQAQQKATYPALYGILQSRDIAADLAAKAMKELDCYGERASRLRELGQFLVARRS